MGLRSINADGNANPNAPDGTPTPTPPTPGVPGTGSGNGGDGGDGDNGGDGDDNGNASGRDGGGDNGGGVIVAGSTATGVLPGAGSGATSGLVRVLTTGAQVAVGVISAAVIIGDLTRPAPPGENCGASGTDACGDSDSGETSSTLEARGYWGLDAGAEEWGRRNNVDPDRARNKAHGIKQGDKGRGKDDYGVNPETGDVINPDGESVGNLGE